MRKNISNNSVLRSYVRGRSAFLIILHVVCLFAFISCSMLFSAANGNMHPWAIKQLFSFIIMILIMLLIRAIDIRYIYRYAYHIYAMCLLSLVVADILGYTTMGAQRWIRIGSINLQPSEFAKIGVILALARYFHDGIYSNLHKPSSLLIILSIFMLPAIFILRQPNLGTTIIVVTISVCMCFCAGLNMWFFIAPAISMICVSPLVWRMLYDYQKKRIMTFLNPENDLLGAGYNIYQSKIAIGAGGFLGTGFMQGSQNQLSFLPEKHTDFILTLLAEEWGFAGCMLIFLLYIILLTVCYRIAFNSFHQFSRIIAIGVATMIFIHIFINVGMISGLLPVVGTPIPLLSYGGSNLAAILIGIGILLGIDRQYQDHRRL